MRLGIFCIAILASTGLCHDHDKDDKENIAAAIKATIAKIKAALNATQHLTMNTTTTNAKNLTTVNGKNLTTINGLAAKNMTSLNMVIISKYIAQNSN